MNKRRIRILIASSKPLEREVRDNLMQTAGEMLSLFGEVEVETTRSTNDEVILDLAVGFYEDGKLPFDFVLYHGFESNCALVEKLNAAGIQTIIMNYLTGQYCLGRAVRKKGTGMDAYDIKYRYLNLQ